MHFLASFPPHWIVVFIRGLAPDVAVGPETTPGGWHDTIGLLLLAGVLVALLVAWRWPPPGRGGANMHRYGIPYRDSPAYEITTRVS
jgi:hypothetical protein